MAELARDSLDYPVIDLPNSVAGSPESVILFMIGTLVEQGRLSEDHAARAACQVVRREHQGSTALGRGAALPHAKSEVPGVIGLIGRSPTSLQWQTPDGVPVREACLLLTPAAQPGVGFQALQEAGAVLSSTSRECA